MRARFLDEYLEDVQITSVTGDAAKGGWEAQLQTFQDTDAIEERQTVALPFRYFSPEGWDEDARVGLIGHALPLGFDFDLPFSTARFGVATSHRFLENASLQGIGFQDQSTCSPAYNDHQILDLRIGHIIKHIVEEHTNISSTAGINPEGWVDTSDIDVGPPPADPDCTTRVNRYNVHATNNMWSTLQNIARNEFYYIYFDRQNALHYISDPMFDAVPPVPVTEFTGAFCAGRPTVKLRAQKKVSTVTLKAVDMNGTVYTSVYPTSPADEGRPKELTRIRVAVGDAVGRLDALALRVYAWETRDYTVEWPAPGWCGFFFDLLDRVEVTYTGTSANGVDIDWHQKKFWIHRIQMTPGPGQTGMTRFTLEEEPDIPAP